MDKSEFKNKKEKLEKELSELKNEVSKKEIINSPEELKKISKMISDKRDQLDRVSKLTDLNRQIKDAQSIIKSEEEHEMIELATKELTKLKKEKKELDIDSKRTNKDISKKCILEIRAGTGGDEASLFAYDLFRMYSQYAKSKNWKTSILSKNESSTGGLKEIIALINGQGVYEKLQFESGVHRVQRIPVTESSGRIHTSAASVVVYPLIEEKEVSIDEKDIKIDVYRSSGPGGQSVNTTDSAVRLTHIPTGIVVTCQDEKSQHKNKRKALTILASKIADGQKEERQDELSQIRKSAIKTGDRSDKIRTYNFPQDRITDHRIKKSWHNIKSVLDGNIEHILETLPKSI